MDVNLTNAVLRAMRRILRATDQGARKLASATGLTPSQILVLREVEAREETTPGAVASHLEFGQATVSEIAERLAALGLLTRSRGERDKRQILLRATTKGRTLLDGAPNLLQERFRQRFEGLPSWEQAMLLASLERLAHLLDAPDGDFAPLIDSGNINRDPERSA